MCQAYDAEAAFIRRMESRAAKQGYKAHRDGKASADNPYRMTDIYNYQAWAHGWSCRNTGVIPWAITSDYRDKRLAETGKHCWETPTREQADLLV
jgi:ribosome modulation factor